MVAACGSVCSALLRVPRAPGTPLVGRRGLLTEAKHGANRLHVAVDRRSHEDDVGLAVREQATASLHVSGVVALAREREGAARADAPVRARARFAVGVVGAQWDDGRGGRAAGRRGRAAGRRRQRIRDVRRGGQPNVLPGRLPGRLRPRRRRRRRRLRPPLPLPPPPPWALPPRSPHLSGATAVLTPPGLRSRTQTKEQAKARTNRTVLPHIEGVSRGSPHPLEEVHHVETL